MPRARASKPGEAVVTSPMKTALHEKGCGQQGQAYWRQKISENSRYLYFLKKVKVMDHFVENALAVWWWAESGVQWIEE